MSERLKPAQERAAQLIANGVSQVSAANHEDVKVTKQTMNRWCHDQAFQDRVKELQTTEGLETQDILEGGRLKAAQVIVATIEGNIDPDPKVAKLRFDASKYALDLLKVKKLPPPGKPTRATRRRTVSDAEMDEMMEPLDDE